MSPHAEWPCSSKIMYNAIVERRRMMREGLKFFIGLEPLSLLRTRYKEAM